MTIILSILLFFPLGTFFFLKDGFKRVEVMLIALLSYYGVASLILAFLGLFKDVYIYLVVGLITLVFFWLFLRGYFKSEIKFPRLRFASLFFIISLAIVSFELWSVHFNYTGEISSSTGKFYVENDSYRYPMFSDEWAAVAIQKKIIDTQEWYGGNPLDPDSKFSNFAPAFFTFFAFFFVYFGVTPVLSFGLTAVLMGIFLCVSVYFVLRSYGVREWVASTAMLAIPFVINGPNVPGIWFLLPYNLALIVFVLGLGVLKRNGPILGSLAVLMSVLFYPLISILVVPLVIMIVIVSFNEKILDKKRFAHLVSWVAFAVIMISFGIVAFAGRGSDILTIWNKILSRFFHKISISYKENFLPWTILPWPLFLFFYFFIVISIKKFTREHWPVLLSVGLGLMVWSIAYFGGYELVIGHPRIASITSYLTVILFGLSVELVISKNTSRELKYFNDIERVFPYFILLPMIFIIPFYTTFKTWDGMYVLDMKKIADERGLSEEEIGKMFRPVFPSPVTRYFTNDDLMIFRGIEEKIFISDLWKSLTIGATTNNYPLQAKKSFVGVQKLETTRFSGSSCEEKINFALDYEVDYVYLRENIGVDCDKFVPIQKSLEGYILFKFNKE